MPACRIEEIDAAGIYLKDELLDQINLVAYRGLSSEFVKSVSTYKADSPEARQIWTEKPIYKLDFYLRENGRFNQEGKNYFCSGDSYET